jgi:hypothetical protein
MPRLASAMHIARAWQECNNDGESHRAIVNKDMSQGSISKDDDPPFVHMDDT